MGDAFDPGPVIEGEFGGCSGVDMVSLVGGSVRWVLPGVG